AESILLIATPDLPTLRNTKKVLPLLERSLGSAEKVRLVLNRHDPADVITPSDVSRVLGREVYWSLENDVEQVAASLNEGEPVVFRSKSRYARDLRELAESLAGKPTPNGGRRRGIAGLFRRGDARRKEE
ncbi:MAG: AAA family ATPase, partial [Longimicrobiales bacterium]